MDKSNVGVKRRPIEAQLEAVRKYHCIELPVIPSDLNNPDSISVARRYKERCGFIYAAHMPKLNGADLSTWYSIFLATLDFGRQIDAEVMVIHPVEGDWKYDAANGIKVSVETVDPYCNQTILGYVNEHRLQGVCLDTEHLWIAANHRKSFRTLFEALLYSTIHMHLVDGDGVRHRHMTVGEGNIGESNWRYIFRQLCRRNYSGMGIIESREDNGNYIGTANADKSFDFIVRQLNGKNRNSHQSNKQ